MNERLVTPPGFSCQHWPRLCVVLLAFSFAPGLAHASGGTVTLNGATSGSAVIQVPAVAGSTTFQLPGNNGTSGYVLQTNGAGVTSWAAAPAASSIALSSLTAATTTNSIDSTNYAQTWKWGTLSTQTALTLTSSSMTTGTLVSLSNAATGNNAGTVLSVSNSEANAASYGINVSSATTGAGYGIYSGLTAANTGYAIYATNAATGAGYGVYGTVTGAGNTGYAGYFSNTATTANYGVYATTASKGAGYGVYGSITGASNTGYGGYFTNSSASGWAVYAAGTSPNYFAGNVGIGSASPNTNLDVSGFIEWSGQSRVTSTFSKTSNTTLAAITGLSVTLTAGKTYYFDLIFYTTSAATGGVQFDLNGGTATATALKADANLTQSGTNYMNDRFSSLSSLICNAINVTAATCHITGTITVNAGGTFIPRFAQTFSNSTASTVVIGSTMIVNQIN